MNSAVIWKIYKSKQLSNVGQKVGEARQFKITRVNQMTITLFVVSIGFILTTLPLNSHLIKANLNYEAQGDLLKNARDNLIFAATNLLSYVNNVMNFFLYCFSGYRFRRQLLGVFERKNVVEPSTVIKSVSSNRH